MERLQEMREQALRDPLHFVTALQNGENLNLPGPQEIVQVFILINCFMCTSVRCFRLGLVFHESKCDLNDYLV